MDECMHSSGGLKGSAAQTWVSSVFVGCVVTWSCGCSAALPTAYCAIVPPPSLGGGFLRNLVAGQLHDQHMAILPISRWSTTVRCKAGSRASQKGTMKLCEGQCMESSIDNFSCD